MPGLVAVAGLIACIATVLGYLGWVFWFFDLFSHFRVQYLLGLAAVSVLSFAWRRRKLAALFAVFASVNLVEIFPFYTGKRADNARDTGGRAMRAMLINVNTRAGDPRLVAKALREYDPDIVVLLEISKRWIEDLDGTLDAWPHSRTRPRNDNFGIGVFSKFPMLKAEVVYIGESEVPSIVADIETPDASIAVFAVHPLPPVNAGYFRSRNDLLEKLPSYIHEATAPALLLGDLNTSPWSVHFKRFVKNSGLVDSSLGLGLRMTWPTHNPLLWIPLDHCLHSEGIRIAGKTLGPHVGSDHYPIVVDFILPIKPQNKQGGRRPPFGSAQGRHPNIPGRQ